MRSLRATAFALLASLSLSFPAASLAACPPELFKHPQDLGVEELRSLFNEV